MHLDAIQRAAIRDLLAISIALNATLIMPPLMCSCDRYWGFTQNCRMPTAPQDMPMPYRCSQVRACMPMPTTLTDDMLRCTCTRMWIARMPRDRRRTQDAMFEIKFWNDKGVAFRQADFLDHPSVPQAVKDAVVRVVVHESAPQPAPGSADARTSTVLRPGTPMSDVAQAVHMTNPGARLVSGSRWNPMALLPSTRAPMSRT